MKLSKRTIALMVCAVLAMTTTVFGTIAYLTGTDTVKNTFTVGKVDIDVDEAVTDENGNPVDENGNVIGDTDGDGKPDGDYEDGIYDENGKPVTDEDGDGKPDGDRTDDPTTEDEEEGNDYKLVPGETYTKDPTVTVKSGSEESYIRTKVTVTRLSVLKEALGDDFDFFTDFSAELGEGWTLFATTEDAEADSVTYEVRYDEPVEADAADVVLPPVFYEFTVPGVLDGDDLAALVEEGDTDPFAVVIEGNAIQTASFETVDDAWAAFDDQMNPDDTTGDTTTDDTTGA